MSTKSYWVGGHHAVRSILTKAPERVLGAAVVDGRAGEMPAKELAELLQVTGVSVQVLDKGALGKLVGNEQHQGVALHLRPKQELGHTELLHAVTASDTRWLMLVLDQVQDPHNLGACLRSAAAAGVHAVVIPKDNSAPMSAVVHKVASGAVEVVDVYRVTNLVRSLDELKARGIWVLGTSDRATSSLYAQDLTVPVAVVMGAEGKGLRRLTEDACDVLVSLPMASAAVSSLNVSVATGICLYEAVRQRSGRF